MDYNNNYYFWTKTQDTIKDNVQSKAFAKLHSQ